MKWTPEKWAGIAYVLPTLPVCAIWYALLFVGNTVKDGPAEMLKYALQEAPERLMFWWMIVLPALCLLLAAGYFSTIAQGRAGAIVLCVVGTVVAVAAWFTLDWTIAMFSSLPLLFSVPSLASHLTIRSKPDAP